jgi:hypothetical protein
MSDNLVEEEELIFSNTAQYNSAVAASVISRRESSRNSGKVVQGAPRVQKLPLKTLQKQPSVNQILHLRGHKNRDREFFSGQQSIRDTAVHFASKSKDGDVKIQNAETPTKGRSKPSEKGESREKHPKKHQLAQKLEADPHNIVQRVLNTQVQILLKTLIRNIPKVKKRLFQASYTPEEFDGLSVTTIGSYGLEDAEEESNNKRPIIGEHVGSLALGSLLDYVLVEATGGIIQECYSINAEH